MNTSGLLPLEQMASQTITQVGCRIILTIVPLKSAGVEDTANTRVFYKLNGASTVKTFSSLKMIISSSPVRAPCTLRRLHFASFQVHRT